MGDSYDILKQSFLRWLGSTGHWATHPMFTEPVAPQQAKALSYLLGTRLLSKKVLTTATDREAYLAPAVGWQDHVFLDPDTGVRFKGTRGKKAPSYLFDTELVAIASARPKSLTLAFDKCVARGREREQLETKLSTLAAKGLHAVGYASHACFVLVGRDERLVKNALQALKRESRLPKRRFVSRAPQKRQMDRTTGATKHRR